MNADTRKKLEEVARLLDEINFGVPQGRGESMFAAFRECDGGRSMKLSGNADGLAYLAGVLVRLAVNSKEGSHWHFDEFSAVFPESPDRELILGFEAAEWDST